MANQELKATWYSLTFESRRSEHKRTRFEFVTYSRYPMSRLWVEDEVESVAKTAKFRYELKSNDFFILMYLAPEHDYGMGDTPRAIQSLDTQLGQSRRRCRYQIWNFRRTQTLGGRILSGITLMNRWSSRRTACARSEDAGCAQNLHVLPWNGSSSVS